jgi:hypothetical protein
VSPSNKKGEIVSVWKGFFPALTASICGLACAMHMLYASAQFLDFLARTKKSFFPILKHYSLARTVKEVVCL